jgi:hypothetical protein
MERDGHTVASLCRSLLANAAAWALAMVAAAIFSGGVHAASNVMIVFDEDTSLPGLSAINRSLREVFTRELGSEVELYTESLNVSQFGGDDYDPVAREHLRRKYASRRPNLIVAVMQPSLDFLLRHRETLFSGVPIVFCGIDTSALQHRALPHDVTGVLLKRTFTPTIDIALKLQPRLRNLFVVGGVSEFDRQIQGIARRDLAGVESRLRITWLTELGMDALVNGVSAVPADSAILYLTLFADAAGRTFSPHGGYVRGVEVAIGADRNEGGALPRCVLGRRTRLCVGRPVCRLRRSRRARLQRRPAWAPRRGDRRAHPAR